MTIPNAKVTVAIGDGSVWYCRQDDLGFWEAYKADPQDDETGAPVYRFPGFDETVKMIAVYEEAFAEGVTHGETSKGRSMVNGL